MKSRLRLTIMSEGPIEWGGVPAEWGGTPAVWGVDSGEPPPPPGGNAIIEVRVGGVWVPATIEVRSGGVWVPATIERFPL